MNIVSKSKKRVVLPSRPDPPTVDQILEDISRAAPDDPVFNILEKTGEDSLDPIKHQSQTKRLEVTHDLQHSPHPADREVELRFQQCRRYLELNEQLQEARDRLLQQTEELRAAGERVDREVAEIKGQEL